MVDSETERAQPAVREPQAHEASPPLHRACEACKRRKTRCTLSRSITRVRISDMVRPRCSLCIRMKGDCIYPSKRKSPTFKHKVRKRGQDRENENLRSNQIDRLLEMVNQINSRANGAEDLPSLPVLQGDMVPATSSRQSQSSATIATEINSLAPTYGENFEDFEQGHPLHASNGPSPGFSYVDDISVNADTEAFNDTLTDFYAPFFNPLQVVHVGLEQQQIPGIGAASSPDPQYNARHEFQVTSLPNETPSSVSLAVPIQLADELIGLYFEKIHGWLPILHRPQMMARYLSKGSNQSRYQDMPVDDALVLNGMFSLAARFSTSELFAEILLEERGKTFAAEALALLQRYLYGDSEKFISLKAVQGLVLVSNYWMIKGPEMTAWFLTGNACRMAQALGLHNLDDDIITKSGGSVEFSASEWARREERRRAWWEVVRLDIFASVTTRRPFSVDHSIMHVLLPVSDAHWYREEPLPSTFLNVGSTATWKSLVGSENQSPYAYFLVALWLMSTAYTMTQKASLPPESSEDMDTCLSCFVTSLPERFSLEGGNFCYVNADLAREQNWIIATHLIIQNTRSFLIHLDTRVPQAPPQHSGLELIRSREKADDLALRRSRPLLACIMRILRQWTPDHILIASPLLFCALLGPHNYIMRCMKTVTNNQSRIALMRDLVVLTLRRVAQYWHVGSLLLEMFRIQNQNQNARVVVTPISPELRERFAFMLPEEVQQRR